MLYTWSIYRCVTPKLFTDYLPNDDIISCLADVNQIMLQYDPEWPWYGSHSKTLDLFLYLYFLVVTTLHRLVTCKWDWTKFATSWDVLCSQVIQNKQFNEFFVIFLLNKKLLKTVRPDCPSLTLKIDNTKVKVKVTIEINRNCYWLS